MASYLNRDPFPILAVVVIIVAVGLAAATISSIQTSTLGEGPGQGAPQPQVPGGGGGPNLNQTTPAFENGSPTGAIGQRNVIPLTMCIRFLQTPLGLLALLGGYVAFLYIVARQYGGARASLTGYITAPAVFILYFVVTQCPNLPNYGNPVVDSILTQQGGGGLQTVAVPPWLLAIVFGIVFIGGVGMLYLAAGSEETIEPPEEELEEPDMTDFARAAGRAAERIEQHNADINNAVYQAWYEMTTLLDTEDAETMTPGEFADYAVGLGMDEDDVDELTWLFNEVRYGGMEADEEREDRAVEILRNIEEEYGEEADEESPEGPGDGPAGEGTDGAASGDDEEGEE